MTDLVSLAARERRTQQLQNAALFILFAALAGAYLLTLGLPQGFMGRPGELPSGIESVVMEQDSS